MRASRRLFSLSAVVLTCASWTAGPALGDTYPSKAITIVVSYPAGSDTDSIARMLGEKLSVRLKAAVVIDNRPGAGGTIGNNYVSRAQPDGYTLLFTPNPFTTAPMVMRLGPSSNYDVLNGFEPVIQIGTQPLVLVAYPDPDLKTIPDMIAAAKAGKPLSYGSPGAGSPMHIVGEWLNAAAGVKITHVPYKGVAPSVTDVVAGHINTAWVTLGIVRDYVATNRLTQLAIGDAKRSPLAPNVPTLTEYGYKDVIVGAWNGFFAPKGTPNAAVQTLNANLNAILAESDVKAKLTQFGTVPVGGSPEVLRKTNANEYQVMGKVIRDLNISAE